MPPSAELFQLCTISPFNLGTPLSWSLAADPWTLGGVEDCYLPENDLLIASSRWIVPKGTETPLLSRAVASQGF